jgi:putative phosphoribosyl transferase
VTYRNRSDAGQRLVQRLRERIPALDDDSTVVLGIAPGGVVVAREVAVALRAPLDVMVALRLPAPGYDDLGIGGVAMGGTARLDERTIAMLGISPEYIEETVRATSMEADLLAIRYRGGRTPVSLRERRVLVVDDGVQTRYRSRAAVGAARAAGAREVIFAVPVAASDVLEALAIEADAVVCDLVPERHCGIGAHYSNAELPRPDELRGLLSRSTIAHPPRVHRRAAREPEMR